MVRRAIVAQPKDAPLAIDEDKGVARLLTHRPTHDAIGTCDAGTGVRQEWQVEIQASRLSCPGVG